MADNKYSYVRDFEIPERCLPNCWIVIRVDGKGFSKFAEKYKFEKPNDSRSLHLMTLAAKKIMKDFPDIIIAYGQSDEYSFVFRKDTTLHNRRPQKLVSIVTSAFTGHYILNWSTFFPTESLTMPPVFDGRVVLLPANKNLRDYLSWRQVDAHVNNLYNTCFWNLISKKNLTPNEAQLELKGTVSSEKHEIMFTQLGINYNNEPEEFKKGTTILRGKQRKLKALNVDIIKDHFWHEHKDLLEPSTLTHSDMEEKSLEDSRKSSSCT